MRKKIVVFGSFVVDLTARCAKLPRPGETVFSDQFKMGPGGKGSNQAVAAHRAGGDVTLITKVGKDPFASVIRDFYANEGMGTDWVLTDDSMATGVALIGVEETGQNLIVVCPGACTGYTDEDIEKVRVLIESADILLMQFEVNLDAQNKVIDIARRNNVLTVLNPAPVRDIPAGLLEKVDCVTPNETEAEGLTGIKVDSEETAARCAKAFHDMGIKNVVITLGEKGVFVSDGNRHELLAARNVNAIDTTGAGDAFNGAFVTALSEGLDMFGAAEFANRAAALSVTKYGTAPSMPLRKEIESFQ